jgi:1-deoxy-D-xylulose 5-phosphate reductoisomerase
VEAFLAGRIGFTGIWRTVEQVLEQLPHTPRPDLAAILTADADARQFAKSLTD